MPSSVTPRLVRVVTSTSVEEPMTFDPTALTPDVASTWIVVIFTFHESSSKICDADATIHSSNYCLEPDASIASSMSVATRGVSQQAKPPERAYPRFHVACREHALRK